MIKVVVMRGRGKKKMSFMKWLDFSFSLLDFLELDFSELW